MGRASSCHDREFDAFKRILLDMAHQRTLQGLLELIVSSLRDVEDVALARIWLVDVGDICDRCHFRRECPDQSKCLHLVASAGKSVDDAPQWQGLDGKFRRFPIGVRKVGHIAERGEAVEIADIDAGSHWIADPIWAKREQIRGFVGQPLIHKEDVLGVLGVFLRVPVIDEGLGWLRMIADHASVTIANTRALEEIERLRTQLELENEYLRDEVKAARDFGEIIGGSPALQKVLEQVQLVAPTDTNVLVLGESGVGKELIARAIHEQSLRKERPMIKVNCASIPRELFESEFFGHVQGSFTGAVRDRIGRFELADGGTLFLDEVGEIPLDMQSKLLRVLQEGTYERIGEERTRVADVRIVAATNRDLEDEVRAKRFREDLFYRLSVFPIEVLPLRDRRLDIPALVTHFLEQHSSRLGMPVPALKKRHVAELSRYDWPGNIRELQNVVERAVIRARSGALQFELPRDGESRNATGRASVEVKHDRKELLSDADLRQLERENMLAVLEHHNWRISGTGGAAKFLGVHPATLSSRLQVMGIERPR
ncbi:sigma 54-interacting transcriptional regulator [Pirellulales bacterium]|nr:sigma 54-interacting transcriptional regulator [Pirellulales bacterium]